MKPGPAMWLGFMAGLVGIMATVLTEGSATAALIVFAGGALFGKGYGVWEERERL